MHIYIYIYTYMYTYIYMHVCIPFRTNEGAIERCEENLSYNLYHDPFELCSRSLICTVRPTFWFIFDEHLNWLYPNCDNLLFFVPIRFSRKDSSFALLYRYMHIYIHIYMHIYVYPHMYTYIHLYIYICIYKCIWVCVHQYVYMNLRMIYIFKCTYTYVYVCPCLGVKLFCIYKCKTLRVFLFGGRYVYMCKYIYI